jgi:putative acyl-CoA dehydrogenase
MDAMTATHEVFNQSTPLTDANLFEGNRPLHEGLTAHLPPDVGGGGRRRGGGRGGRGANVHPPQLRSHDRQGRRIDEVEFHPSYHALMTAAVEHGLHARPWALGSGAHVERAAGFMLFTELEPSVLCPVSMTYAATPALRGNPAVLADWFPKLTGTT